MRRELWIAAILLPLGGCYAPADTGYAQPGYGYDAQPGYAQPGYPPPGYPAGGYAPSPYDPGAAAYPGYSYNGGAPTYIDGGVSVPLVFFGGEWGYYDHDRRWHHAPDHVSRDLEAHRAGGQFHQGAPPHAEPGFQPRPPQPNGRPAERPGMAPPQAAFRPAEQPRMAPPQAAFRPQEPPRPAAPVAARPHEEHGRGRDCQPGQHC